jgi:hypothetical protein
MMAPRCRWFVPATILSLVLLHAQDSPFRLREPAVEPSPSEVHQVALPAGQKVIDLDVWPTGGEAIFLVHGANGEFEVRSWRITTAAPTAILSFDPGFEPRAIACHPVAKKFFVSGRSNGQSLILAVELQARGWRARTIYQTREELRRLLVSPRPYVVGYRLVFARRLADGNYSTRSITEDGKVEYQIVGPKAAWVNVPGAEVQPNVVVAPSALPVAFHPAGHILLWQDGRGCFQRLVYEGDKWGTKVSPVAGNTCGGSLTVTPNGAALLHWQSGQTGITLIGEKGRSRNQQAAEYSFISTPSSVPDGLGIVGVIESGSTQTLVFAPITVPLANVVNAWMFVEDATDTKLLAANNGLFRQTGGDQVFQLYDTENYSCGGYSGSTPTRPYFVTTDIVWELVAAAYEGMFIVQERQQGIPAFWSFVDAANAALHTKSRGSPWASAFAAVARLRSGNVSANAEADRISRSVGRATSPVFGHEFDYAELRPRGHYTSTAEMGSYFKAVHYLTALAAPLPNGRGDAAELASLPAEVKAKALAWIGVYRHYIAPSRAPLVWSSQSSEAPTFARHPLDETQVFPLSWGFDNEVLLSTVFHDAWPPAEQIQTPGGERKRLLPSGLDLAAVLGSGLARSLLRDALRNYPPLGPVMEALGARRPSGDGRSLYDSWINSLAVQWADGVAFPGLSGDQMLWKSKRLQTGLASWATLRHATVLVNERTEAECGEAGFEEITMRPPRGYVEPDPKTFAAMANLLDQMSQVVLDPAGFQQGSTPANTDRDEPLRSGIRRRLRESADKARLFQAIAEKEIRGEELSEKEYEEILYVGRAAEHNLLVFKSLAKKDLALSNPDPIMKVADVAGGSGLLLEAAVGRPMEWDQVVPFFGRREIVKGSVYSYYEFTAPSPMNDGEWRKQVDRQLRPEWIASFVSERTLSCPARSPF